MVVRAANAATRRRPRPQITQASVIPAPTNGVDARVSLAAGDMSVCPYAYNIMPDEAGMRVRLGYREFVLEVEGAGTSYGVSTIIPMEGIAGADDKLFAVTNEGIFDVTSYNTTPTKKQILLLILLLTQGMVLLLIMLIKQAHSLFTTPII